tara:strand:+ start:3569 stop:4243 length:675 start_codon:yes stop_codon:yes gene_type:complete
MNKSDKILFINALVFPFLFTVIMWGVKLIEIQFNLQNIIREFGVSPRDLSGVKGILFAPFIHKDVLHLSNNSLPILILGWFLFFSYKKIAKEIFLWLFFVSGFWLWVIGRPSLHIGASGVIYSLASFLFISGIIRKNPRLTSISLIVVFLYGSMIWGVLPTKPTVSWEGHLSGMVSGIIVAIFFKNDGPPRKKYQWEIDEENENIIESQKPEPTITYTIKKEDK